MNDEPKAKKIKLSLEPSINNKVADITDLGQHIFKTEPTLQEKLMQNVERIWYERGGDWTHITEKSLEEAINTTPLLKLIDDDQDSQEKEETTSTIPTPPPTGYDINKLRESVINKLYHAKSEIDVALDVINILASGNRANTINKENLVIPNGSLTATYVTKPTSTQKAQLESLQLNLGLKRTKQKQASEYLKRAAASLNKLVEKEQVFWDEALDLRRNNWSIQSGGGSSGSSFWIDYGFTQVGSDFHEASMGELKRNQDETRHLQLALPHGTSKRLAVSICPSSTVGLVGGGKKAFSDGILGISSEEQQDYSDAEYSSGNTIAIANSNTYSEIQNHLAKAHSTVFDAELFSNILGEAQALNSNVRFPDDEIIINIDGQIDLSIRKLTSSSSSSSSLITTTPQRIISQTIDLSFRLLLLQHQHYNLWKAQAKILSSNHHIHQLLTLSEQPVITTATSTTAAPATPQQNIPVIVPPALPTAVPSNATALPQQQTRPTSSGNTSVVVNTTNNNTRTTKSKPMLPHHIPILSPILAYTRFWVQFDRIRHVIYKLTKPNLPLSIHFLVCSTSSSFTTSRYESYPGYSQLALSLSISLFKGPFLHFGLNQTGSISVYLAQTTVHLQNVSEFEAFLKREIKVICLKVICDVANERMDRIWKVDQVDEAIHGSIYWKSISCWRNIHVSMDEKKVMFKLASMNHLKEQVYSIHLIDTPKEMTIEAFNFKEKAYILVQKIMKDTSMTTNVV